MEDVSSTLHETTLSKADIFHLDCNITNPKDIWNEFTLVDNSNFDFAKVNILLNQKSKNYFLLKRKKVVRLNVLD